MGKFTNWLFGNDNQKIKNEVQTGTVDITNDAVIKWDREDEESSVITEDKAMSIASVCAGVTLIANSIGSLPIYLYKVNENGEEERINNDYRNTLLNVSSSMFDSAYNLKFNMAKQLILHGETYIYMKKNNRNKIEALYFFDNGEVSPQLIKVGKNYDYKFSFTLFQDYITCGSDEMMVCVRNPKNSASVTGRGILDTNKDLLRLALTENQCSQDNLTNNVPAFLSTPNSLSPQAKENIRNSFFKIKTNSNLPIMEEGLRLEVISTSPDKLQLLESRQYTTQLVCNILNLPLSFLTNATSYNTSEEESLRYTKQCLLPYLRLLEETYNKYLLSAKEQEFGYRFMFDTNALMKISKSQFMDFLSKGVNSGIYTLNEARKEMNLSPRENGDLSQLPVNSYFLDAEGNIILPSQQDADLNEQQEEKEDNVDNRKDEEENKLEEE